MIRTGTVNGAQYETSGMGMGRTYLNFIGLLLAATFACLGILIVLLEESPELFALIMIVTMPYLIVMFVLFVWTKLFYPLWSWLKQFFNSN